MHVHEVCVHVCACVTVLINIPGYQNPELKGIQEDSHISCTQNKNGRID